MPTLETLGLSGLSRDEKISFVQDVWDSIEKQSSSLSDEQLAEIRRRVEEDDQSPDDVVSWEKVKMMAGEIRSNMP